MTIDGMNAVRVMKSGPMATLQDAGRFGVRHQGITQGGAADLHAWAWGNALLGNSWGAAAVEVVLGGLELQALCDLRCAITGAAMSASLDGRPVPEWQAFRWRKGQTLSFGQPLNGVRAYLSIRGGFLAYPVLNSVATVLREKLGGLSGFGDPLREGDELVASTRSRTQSEAQSFAESDIPDYKQPARLSLLPGAQIAQFSGQSLYAAFNQEWRVDTRADRMGVRLNGPRLQCHEPSMISEGISLGSVQVPPDGQPIALLNDRQTIGGYPRLGALTPLSAARLSQCLPGQSVWLEATGYEQAQMALTRFIRRLAGRL